MKIGCISTIVIIWTLVSIILSLCGVGKFAEFPITAWPWNWSCLFVLYWSVIVSALFVAGTVGFAWWCASRQAHEQADKDTMGKVARLIMQNKVPEAYKLAKDTWGDKIPEKVKNALVTALADNVKAYNDIAKGIYDGDVKTALQCAKDRWGDNIPAPVLDVLTTAAELKLRDDAAQKK